MPPKSLAKRPFEMADILNLALPYFGLIFVGYACGKTRGLPEAGLAWMNFFLLYVSLPALLFRIMSDTPFAELNNPPFLIATTLATVSAYVLAMVAGRIFGDLSLRKATMAGLAGAYGNIGYMGPGLALAISISSVSQLVLISAVAVFWFGERPTPRQLAGMALGIAAVVLIAWPQGGKA